MDRFLKKIDVSMFSNRDNFTIDIDTVTEELGREKMKWKYTIRTECPGGGGGST